MPGSIPRQALCLLLCVLPMLAAADDLQARVRQLLEKGLPAGSHLTTLDIGQPAARIRDCGDPRPWLVHPGRLPVGRVAVGVSCGAEEGVLGYLQVRVGAQGNYVVSSRRIDAGEVIAADMLVRQRGALEDLPRDSAPGVEPLLGRQAARAIARGAVVTLKGVRERWLVERNGRVSLRSQGNGFSLSREGKALDNGNLGSSVRFVGNDGRMFEAQVVGKNELLLRH
ncbi:flagellar basal body P-ring formation chaperone FlgA [Pseudomonas sp. 148P]|uniref:Flagella basal body P-ring formation protein FlgA n=1 Tax=Pseudomonas ulcerans TaxID=3115852 RepID=A0ABU7HJK8_9PSED|nr:MULTISPECIES: flagellar basal body P-ring formation chaperone FlgA [unclassified Pseudomonas]MEE1921438.1 flagellar basal body P-ring formation chaperone FlgA [Pseudomonas sp. 147P]MEE1931721.1 flagellar basal body P-ring formation chaperone FlgA [Pseudomonas sp. 148P]